jgi:hypothetical protein
MSERVSDEQAARHASGSLTRLEERLSQDLLDSRAKVKELEAENKRLREELERISLWTGWKIWPRASPSPGRLLREED